LVQIKAVIVQSVLKKCYSGGLHGDLFGFENYIWFLDNSNMTTREVGQKLPNETGLFDMTGNV
jgi:formylglycine-generating enzyme required for sulfatase activity